MSTIRLPAVSAVRNLARELGHFTTHPLGDKYDDWGRINGSDDANAYIEAPFEVSAELDADYMASPKLSDRCHAMHNAALGAESAFCAAPTEYLLEGLSERFSDDGDLGQYLYAALEDWNAAQDTIAAQQARIDELEEVLALVNAGAAE